MMRLPQRRWGRLEAKLFFAPLSGSLTASMYWVHRIHLASSSMVWIFISPSLKAL